jgi:hypothetical protein
MIRKLTKKEIEKEKLIALKEKAKKHAGEFKKEFKKEMNTAILAAFGFLIALVWKDVITSVVDNITKEAHVSNAIVSAIIVTIICVFGIMFSSRLLKNKEENEK